MSGLSEGFFALGGVAASGLFSLTAGAQTARLQRWSMQKPHRRDRILAERDELKTLAVEYLRGSNEAQDRLLAIRYVRGLRNRTYSDYASALGRISSAEAPLSLVAPDLDVVVAAHREAFKALGLFYIEQSGDEDTALKAIVDSRWAVRHRVRELLADYELRASQSVDGDSTHWWSREPWSA
ncbi:hypothetical protein acdb102_31000 [Acidothermaceae bacterium B102]|nr:hypothetical protein acdb102_31000 [Acidothermaceae bacterium B102]